MIANNFVNGLHQPFSMVKKVRVSVRVGPLNIEAAITRSTLAQNEHKTLFILIL